MVNTVTPSSPKWIVLNLNGTRLALPQSEVVSVEVSVDMQRRQGMDYVAGIIVYDGVEWPVYTFSSTLELLPELSPQHIFCLCVRSQNGQAVFALACNSAEILHIEADDALQPVPDSMLSDASPLRYLMKQNEQVVLMTEATALHSYLNSLGVDHG